MTAGDPIKPKFFKNGDAFRTWLLKHHAVKAELYVGFYRKDSGKGGLTYPDALDQALCFGWIDGVRRKLDEISYTNRFSPRTPTSYWSRVNVARVQTLLALGVMHSAGIAAFERRTVERGGAYSFENRDITFAPELLRQFKQDRAAWKWFLEQPPGYRRTITFWVMSAKRDQTRQGRLLTLIGLSAEGKRHPQLDSAARKDMKKGR